MFPSATQSPEGDWAAEGYGGSPVGQDKLRTLGATGLWKHSRKCPRLLSLVLCSMSLGKGKAGTGTQTQQSSAVPARGCSQGFYPGTAPSPGALPPAEAHPGHSMPVATASLGAAPGSGSHSQSLQVLKHHNRRTGTEGKHHHCGHLRWILCVPPGASQLLTVTMRVFQAVEKTSAPSSPP